MLKVYYRNKFRIYNTFTRKIERLKPEIDRNGRDIWVQGFDTYADAETEMNRLITVSPKYKPYLRIESYSDRQPINLNIKQSDTHKTLQKLRHFSGKGLAENAAIPKKQENRYSAGKWYTREIYFAQSVEYNKGLSTISKKGDPKSKRISGGGYNTYLKLQNVQDTAWIEGKDVAISVRERYDKGEFADRKQIKQWLKKRGYSVKQTRNILHRAFA